MPTRTPSVVDQQPDSNPSAAFQSFLDQHLDHEMLRFTTAGSVDDGKSTLIGRLLHDTKSVYEDQLASIRSSRVNRASGGHMDFSLLTDGLRAEREQGITIDVAYRYFTTSKRKFIIADTPGHEQYTRNMATGASTADVAIVLIDGSKGVLPQSRRHTFIASLLGIPHVLAAVNKMDLAGYSEQKFNEISAEFRALAQHLGLKSVHIVPVSALVGDNVVARGVNMPWYTGPTLLEYLETLPILRLATTALRFPVQLVLRPDANFRGFAGQVAGGVLRTGDAVISLPSRQHTRIKSIVTFDGPLQAASNPQSVTVELEDEIDLSRGDMLVRPNELPHASHHFSAKVVWMHETPLAVGHTYLAKHTTRTVRARVKRIRHRVDVNSFAHLPAERLQMNDIGEVEFETSLPLFFDAYATNRLTGSMILIEPLTNATVGAVMIESVLDRPTSAAVSALPVLVLVAGRPAVAQMLADELVVRGERVVLLDDEHIGPAGVIPAVRAAQLSGAVAITSTLLPPTAIATLRRFLEEETILVAGALPPIDIDAAAALAQQMKGAQPSREKP
jgi:bifunctional enzyme CysN/CysC/sulfate adenylyltransferase subunit 1